MKEELITFETAKLAKEKGFKLNFCREVFYPNPQDEKEYVTTEMIHDYELIEGKEWYSRPTQSLLQRWLREEHNIHITIESYHCLGKDKPFGLGIDAMFDSVWDYVDYGDYPGDTNFDTYEEALEVGLKEGLKLIKQK